MKNILFKPIGSQEPVKSNMVAIVFGVTNILFSVFMVAPLPTTAPPGSGMSALVAGMMATIAIFVFGIIFLVAVISLIVSYFKKEQFQHIMYALLINVISVPVFIVALFYAID